jgi:ABC-2 type transport system ATP-binding protein
VTEPVIQVTDLVKRYGELEAVRGINFEVEPGETFGFLGPNGAGKSTTIKILCIPRQPGDATGHRLQDIHLSRRAVDVRAVHGYFLSGLHCVGPRVRVPARDAGRPG